MAGARLQQVLNRKIEVYLTQDNPEPKKTESLFEQATSMAVRLFSHSGETGRKRAKAYQRVINGNMNDDNLARDVLKDITMDDSSLGTSTVLRLRLLEGLCEYYGIQPDVIQAEIQKQRNLDVAKMAYLEPDPTTLSYAMVMRTEYELKRTAMITLITSMVCSQSSSLRSA